ncbi:hypothetical protein IWQ62_006107 [Dispira parvispora]|uniref:WG repeat-containing protein n=1 Tax=Dispira parvispora TaxID=1520584 RepID=A0A9W8DYX9_9FUNG|nr:hypothetical protein IWQ62_006107 [Dispira parvispora]
MTLPDSNPLEFKIYSEKYFTRTRLIADSEGNVLYAIKNESIASNKRLEDYATGQTLWQVKGRWGFVNEVDFIAAKLHRKYKLGGDEFRFEYDAVPYKWVPKDLLSKYTYQCFHRDTDEPVADFNYKHCSRTFGTVTIYPKEGYSKGLIQLLIFTVFRIVQVQRNEDRGASGGG